MKITNLTNREISNVSGGNDTLLYFATAFAITTSCTLICCVYKHMLSHYNYYLKVTHIANKMFGEFKIRNKMIQDDIEYIKQSIKKYNSNDRYWLNK
ncbi:MAG: hypothetical protein ACD_82C00188G0002 [uncultured bacterium]|nr:MAG: hypothetical protein ACD_82C00188G0002 [uncultured bacterium]